MMNLVIDSHLEIDWIPPEIKVSNFNDNLPDKVDIIITDSRGLTGENHNKLNNKDSFIFHLLVCEKRIIKNTEKFNNIERANCLKKTAIGYILPHDGEYSIHWWLDQFKTISYLPNHESHNLFSQLIVKKYEENKGKTISDIRKHFIELLARRSKIAYLEELESGRIEKVHFSSNTINESNEAKEFNEIARVSIKKIKKHISSLPASASKTSDSLNNIHNSLENLLKNGYHKSYSNHIVLAGGFSSGKTTFVNSFIIPKGCPPLNTDQHYNTAMLHEILIKDIDNHNYLLNICLNKNITILEKFNLLNKRELTSEQEKIYNKIYRKCKVEDIDINYYYFEPLGGFYNVIKKIDNINSLGNSPLTKKIDCKFTLKEDIDKKIGITKKKEHSFKSSIDFKKHLNKYYPEWNVNRNFKHFPLISKSKDRSLISIEVNFFPKNDDENKIEINFDNKMSEDNLISYLDSYAEISLPYGKTTSWIGYNKIIDTPGFNSPNIQHNTITFNRLDNTIIGDIILCIVKCRGGPKGIHSINTDYIRTIIKKYCDRKLFFLINWFGSQDNKLDKYSEKETINNFRTKLKEIWNEIHKSKLPSTFTITCCDFSDSDPNGNKSFRKELSLALRSTIAERSQKYADIIQESVLEDCIEADEKFIRDHNTRVKEIKRLKKVCDFISNSKEKIIKKDLQGILLENELEIFNDISEFITLIKDKKNYKNDDFFKIKEIKKQIINKDAKCLWILNSRLKKDRLDHRYRISKAIKNILINSNKSFKRLSLEDIQDDWLGMEDVIKLYDFELLNKVKKLLSKLFNELKDVHGEYSKAGIVKKILDKLPGFGWESQWTNILEKSETKIKALRRKLKARVKRRINKFVSYIYEERVNMWKEKINSDKKQEFDLAELKNDLKSLRNQFSSIAKD